MAPDLELDDVRVDRDALDAAAAAAVAGLTVDLAAAQAMADTRRRDAIRRRLALTAAAAAVILVALALTPAAALLPPLPASVPTGPASLPRTVAQAPAWVPTAVQAPIGRAVYVLAWDPDRQQDQRPDDAFEPVLVGADGGEYRRLPGLAGVGSSVGAVALSRDGRRAAWTVDLDDRTRVSVLQLSTGRVRSLVLPDSFGRGVAVTSLAFSPDGSRLAVSGNEQFAGSQGRPTVYLLDAGTAALLQECEGCGSASDGVAWSGAGALLVADGSTGLRRGGGSMPGRTDLAVAFGLVPTVESPVVSADGRVRYQLELPQAGADDGRVVLRAGAAGGGPRQVAELGVVRKALLLGETSRGVLLTRTTAGGAQVLLVGPDGGRRTVTSSRGPIVVAAAAGLVGAGRPGPAAGLPRSLTSLAWYRAQLSRPWGGVPLAAWLVLVPAFVFRRPVRRGAGRALRPVGAVYRGMSSRTPVVLGVAVLGGGSLVAGILLPTEAAVVASGDARTPVLPAVLQPQHLLPPRAFDAAGQPRTRRISMLFGATFGGVQRLVGVDADTGTLVRLDDLPGVPQSGEAGLFLISGAQSGGISPNGRFVALGGLVIDLQTATARRVEEAGQSNGGAAVTDDGTLLAIVPGTDNRITIARPGERGRTLDGSEGTTSLEPTADGLVLTRLFVQGEANTESRERVDVIDPVSRRYLGELRDPGEVSLGSPVTAVRDGPGDGPGGGSGGSALTPVTVDATTGAVRVGSRTVRPPGSVERLAGGLDGAIAGLGYGGPGVPLAVLRAEPGEGELRPLTRITWPQARSGAVAIAPGVVSQSRVVDVDLPRWDGWVGWRMPLRWAGGLVLLWAFFVILARWPARPAPSPAVTSSAPSP